jgi:flagellar biosynthesis protein FlhF
MKIKRFEALNMSDALRMIKKEFGEEAVILSAKSLKKTSRLLGNTNTKQVVVTAAIDNSPAHQTSGASQKLSQTANNSDGASDKPNRNASNGMKFLKHFKPITRTGQRKLQPKLVRMMSQEQPPEETKTPALEQMLITQGVDEALAADLNQKTSTLLTKGLHVQNELRTPFSQVLTACGVVGPVGSTPNDAQRILVMVGAAGVGKTTTAAKFSAKHAMQYGEESVALLSLDNQRIAGQAELKRYAHIMGVELKSAYQVSDIKRELDALRLRRLIVVDTPGMAAHDQVQLENLRRLIKAIPGAVVNLILNADADSDAMAKAVRFFKPVGPHGLIYTKIDWASRYGGLINMSIKMGLPISHLCDSPKVPEGIQIAAAEKISALVLPKQHINKGQQEQDPVVTVVRGTETQQMDNYYIANRNSDIFHQKNCTSIKRINKDNTVVFKDPAEAMGQQFKPCRMCCSELIISKPVQRLARNYASNR